MWDKPLSLLLTPRSHWQSTLNAYIVEAVRTPGGKNRGLLSNYHAVDLGAIALKAIVERAFARSAPRVRLTQHVQGRRLTQL